VVDELGDELKKPKNKDEEDEEGGLDLGVDL